MPDPTPTLRRAVRALHRHRGMFLPMLAAALIFVILVPLPPGVIDVLLAANIALAAIILLTTIYVSGPLEFSVFPSVLLGATLFRLVLNVATTRLILTAGADGGTPEQARLAAGRVIWSFSDFVAAGSLTVGLIIFAIIVVIQFVVVTKGAARISEVAARFVLDAMPGKQMAIDADLKAGLTTEGEARRRRRDIAREAEFYGAMDGASKFLRGDAIAAVIITFVNILGGLYVGMVQYGWTWDQTAALFTRLTIGDGLVTQIPAFIVAVSAALIITRSTARTNLGEEVISQLTSRPVALAITAVFLGALALTSLPKLPLLLLGVGCAGLAWLLSKRRAAAGFRAGTAGAAPAAAPPAAPRGAPRRGLAVDPVRVEVGFALVPLVERQGGDGTGEVIGRIRALRQEIAAELGLVVPPIRVTDDLRLKSHEYVIKVRGARVAGGRLYPAQLLGVGGEHAGRAPAGEITGRQADHPAFDAPSLWIDTAEARRAQMMGYSVYGPATVLMRHLGLTIRRHAAELLTRQHVAALLKDLSATHGLLVAEVRERLKLAQVQKVLQALLREGVSIADLETILEVAADAAEATRDVHEIAEQVRGALASTISQQAAGEDGRIWCVCLEPELERALSNYVSDAGRTRPAAVPPKVAEGLTAAFRRELTALRQRGRRPVVLCAPGVRAAVRELVTAALPEDTTKSGRSRSNPSPR